MKTFSQRIGLKPIKNIIQTDSMDLDLRNGLWNCLSLNYWNRISGWISEDKGMGILFKNLWLNLFKETIDTLDDYWHNTFLNIKGRFYHYKWNEVYDFIEFVANNHPSPAINEKFMNNCNEVLKKELSAYRFVSGNIIKITAEEEIDEINKALKDTLPLKLIHNHLETALKLLSNRKNPDYRNSIKESISAVEGLCKMIENNPKGTLGKALSKIENKVKLHKDLKEAFKNLYGYTSDSDGIRHALMEETNLDFEDAKFMLVSCSAFINYLIVKSSKARIKI